MGWAFLVLDLHYSMHSSFDMEVWEQTGNLRQSNIIGFIIA